MACWVFVDVAALLLLTDKMQEGEPLVLEVVKKAELKMVMDPKPNKVLTSR